MKKNNKTKYQFTILHPGGNDQMLIRGLVPKNKKRLINDAAIKRFPNVEQVSFYKYDGKKKTANLELAGGEFCGNALRSLAFLLLKGKRGEININVSGTTEKLKAGVKRKNIGFAQMPMNKSTVKKVEKNVFRVNLDGITHLVYLDKLEISDPENLKSKALDILKKENLIYPVPASGVMFIKQYRDFIELKPVVWVRDIETLLYETACASGTAAIGLWKSAQSTDKETTIKVKQPSNEYIQARVRKNRKQSIEVFIEGPIRILKRKGVLTI